MVLAHPPEFKLMPGNGSGPRAGAEVWNRVHVVDDMDEAFKEPISSPQIGARLFTTDTAESAKIIDKYHDWITDDRRMKLAKEDCIYMHLRRSQHRSDRLCDRWSQLGGL